MFRRITVGLKGGILRVASAAEVAARLLLMLVGDAGPSEPESWLRTGLSCPWRAVGGCWIMLARLLGSATAAGWPLALVCLWASGFCGAGLWDSPSESGAALVPPCHAPFFFTIRSHQVYHISLRMPGGAALVP